MFLILGFLLAGASATLPDPPAVEATAEGDALYARRAEGAQGRVADPAMADAAIAAYRRALSIDPRDLEAQVGLLRALFFRGGFCAPPKSQQVRIFEEAKRLAEDSIRQLETGLGLGKGLTRLQALRGVPAAPRLYFWAAISWGQWSMDHKLSAARQGAAKRVRYLAQTAADLDSGMNQGSPFLILGRLHAECPRIPLLTSWISRRKALSNLRQALAHGPANTPTLYFLAEAILDFEPEHEAVARRLLEQCASASPRPEFAVEDAHYAEKARRRLASVGKSDK